MATASIPNPVKEMMKAGKVALGMNVRLARSGDIARIAKSSGHDFIFIDIQHSLFNIETIGHIAQAALGCGIAPLVRVRNCDDPDTSVLLDNGVTGIVFPDISTADEARRAVNRARFPPIGKRSVGGGYPIFDYRPVNVADAVPALQENTLVVCMIETREGLENIEEICAVDGIDVIHVGSNDLLTALGQARRLRQSRAHRRAGSRDIGRAEARQDTGGGRRPQRRAPGRVHPQGRALHHHQQRDRVHHD